MAAKLHSPMWHCFFSPIGISKKPHGIADDHLLLEVCFFRISRDSDNSSTNRSLNRLCLFQEGTNIYSATLPPDWVGDVDAVNATIVDIQSLMSELASMHASRIGTVFGRDLDSMEKQIERKTTEVTTLFRKAERYLQKVGASTKKAGGEEATVGANVQRR